ncbi:hypothetical protein KUTeg_024902 [Tegillarca granosa]|uniref:Receptor ligand binding region domain-containing protein n=1 Tax=Tegillarca granosa TaxID=220873 RepID=A0ABQ9DYQ3_TEGGR|nr:hypothetical protein KUTeg_024902 [Tegillarca granosa]
MLPTQTLITGKSGVCQHLEKGVFAILGLSKSCALATVQSYSDTFQVPFITLSMPQNSSTRGEPYQLYMRPYYIDGLLDVIQHYKWNKILYIYDNDEEVFSLYEILLPINN